MGNCRSINGKSKNRKVTLAILGLDNAGKTVTAKGLIGENVEGVTPTIGFSSVSFQFDNHDVTLFDLGGGRSIRDIWSKYFAEVHGVIYVVDASATHRLRESQSVFENLLKEDLIRGKPILLLANKQDVKGALDESDICDRLQVESLVNKYKTPCRVETCSATTSGSRKQRKSSKLDDDSIRLGLKWLLTTIDTKWSVLNERVEEDSRRSKDKENRDKVERTERIRRSRELRDDSPSSVNGDDLNGRGPYRSPKLLSRRENESRYGDGYSSLKTRNGDDFGRSSTRTKFEDESRYDSKLLHRRDRLAPIRDDDLPTPRSRPSRLSPITSHKTYKDDLTDSDSDRRHSDKYNGRKHYSSSDKYGSLDRLNGRKSATIDSFDRDYDEYPKRKPRSNQTAPFDDSPPRYSSYDDKIADSRYKGGGGSYLKPQRSLARIDERSDDDRFSKKWNLLNDDFSDSDRSDHNYGRRSSKSQHYSRSRFDY